METTFSQKMTASFAVAGVKYAARAWVASLLDHMVFGFLLILITLVAIPYGTVEVWWVAVYECVVFALGALWIIEGLLTGTRGLRQYRLIVPLLLLALFAFIQTVPWGAADTVATGLDSGMWRAISADPFETRLLAWKLLALILNGMLLLRYTSNQRRVRSLIYVVIGVAVASALFGIARQALQGNAQGFFLPYLEPNSGYAQFINKNHFALLMEMSLGLVLGLIVRGGVRSERLPFYGAAAFLMWAALVLTNSRGGIFSMFSQLLFLVTMLGFVRPTVRDSTAQSVDADTRLRRVVSSLTMRLVLITCLLTAVVVSIMWVGGDVLATRLQSLPDEISAASAETHAGVRRMEIWRATWQLIKAHPIAGNGFGGYGVAVTRYHNASGKWTPEAAHNDYLELLASGGIIGVAFAAWFGLAFIKRAREGLRAVDSFRRGACLGALTGLFGVTIHSAVDFGLHVTVNALVFIVLIVIATINVCNEKQTPADLQGSTRRVPN
jgi:O-antigen ligase